MLPDSDDKASLLRQARACEQAGDLAGVIGILAPLLARLPPDRDALLALVRVNLVLNNPDDARTLLDLVLAADPENAEALLALAGLCLGRRDGAGAEAAARRLLTAEPGHRRAAVLLGKAVEQQGRRDLAAEVFGEAVLRYPDDAGVLLEAGYFFRRQDDHAAAARLAGRLIALDPGLPLGWVTLGVARYNGGDPCRARRCFERAIVLDPTFAPARFSLACLDFSAARWAEGFAGFRWRRQLPEAPRQPSAAPPWRGDEPPGARVLVWNDQGLGDAIQFLRFVPRIAARGHRPVVMVPAPLARLAAGMPGVAEVVAAGPPLPAVDAQIAVCDLPDVLGQYDPGAFWSGPYAAAGEGPRLPPAHGLRVGLVWAGSPLQANDGKRSIGLAPTLPWRDLPGIDWFSLQVGPRGGEIGDTPWRGRMVDLAPLIGDFADTAALIGQLDLVISVCTSTVHLAGALGARTWLLLPHVPDWRWPAEGERTPWYPSLRLFRQPRPGDWPAVVDAVAQALAGLGRA